MAKVLRVVAKIAGVVAVVATVLGNPLVAAIATAVATVAGIGAQLLAKPPPARGSPTQVLVETEPPRPYVMGEGLIGGVVRYDRAYGYEDDVPNPFRWIVMVYSGVTATSIAAYTDFEPVSSWYTGYLHTDTQLGACPEANELQPIAWPGAPNWDSTSKLSGCAAIGWNLHFDKKGKRFASGLPQLQAYGQWSKVYDPRLDSTRAGGSGSHRVDDEDTWEWSENPALHAGTYAYGRYQNGVKVMGIGMPDAGVDWTAVAAWANDCEANDWTIFGRIFEPADRWANLKEICTAGGGKPVFSGGKISFDWNRPRVTLGTITEADLGEGRYSKVAGRGYTDRYNAIIPKYTDPDSNWQQMSAGEVKVDAYVTADGEKRLQEYPFNLVKNVDQAAQLARYVIEDSREQQPIVLPLLPQWRMARPGEAYALDLPSLGFTGETAVVIDRQVNPQTFEVTLTFRQENDDKHAEALATVGVPPAAIGTVQSGQDRDETAAVAGSVSNTDVIYDGGTAVIV